MTLPNIDVRRYLLHNIELLRIGSQVTWPFLWHVIIGDSAPIITGRPRPPGPSCSRYINGIILELLSYSHLSVSTLSDTTPDMKLEPCNPPVVDPLFADQLAQDSLTSCHSTSPSHVVKPNISLLTDAATSQTPLSLDQTSLFEPSFLSFKSPLVTQFSPWQVTSPLDPTWTSTSSFSLTSNYFEKIALQLNGIKHGDQDPEKRVAGPTDFKIESILKSDSKDHPVKMMSNNQGYLTECPRNPPSIKVNSPNFPPFPATSAERNCTPSPHENSTAAKESPLPEQISSETTNVMYPTRHIAVPDPHPPFHPEERSSMKRPFSETLEADVSPPSTDKTLDGRIILSRAEIEESRELLRAKRPRLRHEIGREKVNMLESWFEKYCYLSKEGRQVLAQRTGLPVKTVMYWFQNKRRMMKQKTGIDNSTSMARLMKC